MDIIVDTNIVFSAILTSTGKIAELLANKPAGLNYFTPNHMLKELETHSKKLLSLTAYTRDEYDEARNFVIQQIQVVAITNISLVNQKIAGEILIDIDKEDAPFLALAFEKNAMLWTGDKKLIKGLSAKEHFNIITTDILYSQYY